MQSLSRAQSKPLLAPSDVRSDGTPSTGIKAEKPNLPRKGALGTVYSAFKTLAQRVKYVVSPLGLRADMKTRAANEKMDGETKKLLMAISAKDRSDVGPMRMPMNGAEDREFKQSLARVVRDMSLEEFEDLQASLDDKSNPVITNRAGGQFHAIEKAVTGEAWRLKHGKSYTKPVSTDDVIGPNASRFANSDVRAFVKGRSSPETMNFLEAIEAYFTGGKELNFNEFEMLRHEYLAVGSPQELNVTTDETRALRSLTAAEWSTDPAKCLKVLKDVRSQAQGLFFYNIANFMTKPVTGELGN